MSRRSAFAMACLLAVCVANPARVRADEDEPTHWIGIACSPADADVLKKLDLKNGLVVEQVVPKSPAAKAGIQAGDVLVNFDESNVKEVYQLLRLVNEHKDQTVKLRLFRDGKPLTVKVAIARRPQEIQFELKEDKPEPKKEAAEREPIKVKARKAEADDSVEARIKALEARALAAEERAKAAESKARAESQAREKVGAELKRALVEANEAEVKARATADSVRRQAEQTEKNAQAAEARARDEAAVARKRAEERLVADRATLSKAIEVRAAGDKPMPKNLRVVIAKVGEKPAQANIERDGQKWEVTEESLDKLPQELRDHVRELLRKTAAGELGGKKVELKQDRIITIPGGGQRIEVQIEGGDAKPRIHLERFEPLERREGGKGGAAEMRVIKVESPEHRNLEKRLDEIERKLDAVLKRLDDSAKPAKSPKKKKNES